MNASIWECLASGNGWNKLELKGREGKIQTHAFKVGFSYSSSIVWSTKP